MAKPLHSNVTFPILNLIQTLGIKSYAFLTHMKVDGSFRLWRLRTCCDKLQLFHYSGSLCSDLGFGSYQAPKA